MKYNYIIYNFGEDYLRYLTAPWSREPNVLVHTKGVDGNKITDSLFFYHWSHKINQIVNLPAKSIWFKSIYKNPFKDNKPICFVFAGGKYITQSNALRRFILRQNPENKCIIYCGDLIGKKDWDIERVKNCCDAIVTYDPGEAEKYGIYCYNKPLYGRIAPLSTPDTFDYDIYYLGFAKDRLDMIRNVYKRLIEAGLRCKFIVCGVKKEDQRNDGINYGKPISYEENINYINRSKCLLEIIQKGSSTATLRREESIIYKRKLLTNFIGIQETDYYNPQSMSTFMNPEDINIDFLRSTINYSAFIDEDELAPRRLLEFFEIILENQNG